MVILVSKGNKLGTYSTFLHELDLSIIGIVCILGSLQQCLQSIPAKVTNMKSDQTSRFSYQFLGNIGDGNMINDNTEIH